MLCGARTENHPRLQDRRRDFTARRVRWRRPADAGRHQHRSCGRPFWVTNNWQDVDTCYGKPIEALSTRCGGQGVVVFYGMAKPVRVPQIGPVRQP